ncbi:MAG: hypothetical protein PUA95_06715 [Lactimicrobium massiliense]|nr:hypothetical protein [Lactimicrobium massiliense]MDD6230407.1 hypothetical protein [Lactimicrobium massiliense]MDD6560965.1 hypothetical protein [Lactimicrobium massiliense]
MANQYKGIAYLRRKMSVKRSRVLMRYKYYEMKDSHQPRNLMVPPSLRSKFRFVSGWCTKAVDSLADRLQFRGFDNDNFDMGTIFQMNNSDVLFDSAILGALISSCDFIYISQDEFGNPRLQVIDGANATGIIDPITNMLEEGYAVLQRDPDTDKPILEAYFVAGETVIYQNGMKPYSVSNPAPYPLLVPIINRPDAKRPFGHSRISRACMSYQDNTKDALMNMCICSEVNSFPQKYIIGMDPDADPLDGEQASMARFLQVFRSSDQSAPNPTVGQFAQAQMTPYIDEIKTYASLFAGETGLTADDLGFTTANPASYDAIRASHESLRLAARKAQRSLGIGFINAGYLAACLRDNYSYKRNQIYQTKPLWEPIFEPDASAIGLIGDAAVKVNQAVPGYFGDKNLRDLTGMDSDNSTGGSF